MADDPGAIADLTDPTPDETVYKWAIRALYVAAIGLNIWMLADQMKDSEEWAITRRRWDYRLADWKRRAEPMLARLDFRHHADAIVAEAERVVDNA